MVNQEIDDGDLVTFKCNGIRSHLELCETCRERGYVIRDHEWIEKRVGSCGRCNLHGFVVEDHDYVLLIRVESGTGRRTCGITRNNITSVCHIDGLEYRPNELVAEDRYAW